MPVAADPRVEIAKRLRPQRVHPPLPVGPHIHEPAFMQDAQVPRHAGLVNLDGRDDVIDRLLAVSEHVHDMEPNGIGKRLNGFYMHNETYVYQCIYKLSSVEEVL